jgi:hypothetical protein
MAKYGFFFGTQNQYSSLEQATTTRQNRTEYVNTLATGYTILTLYQQPDYMCYKQIS